MFAAIPYFQLGVYNLAIPGLGTLPLDAWAALVCVGFVVGLEVARYRGIRLGLDTRDVVDGAVFIVLMGFFVAHIVTVIFYFPHRMFVDADGAVAPKDLNLDMAALMSEYSFSISEAFMAIARVWQGFSSTGGFIGAIIGAVLFYKFIRPRGALRHADVICFGFPFGWFFGRVGCGVVHDHIGALTTFPLAMEFPASHRAAGIRHELGLYEAALMIPVMLLFYWLGREDRVPGFFLSLFMLLYAPIRFGLDFLRNADLGAQDARYLALTPAQWGMIVLFAVALYTFMRLDRDGFRPRALDGSGKLVDGGAT